ncbi:MAG: glycerol acyltransferase [Chloroflexi bacterium]|uniref:Glycerol acyltransferase n=1 Tax=Candidatus Thermofonsia Clade 3 bacterium TaxID=2364212 RepID=A0A2M8QAJ1_9CHLR|nr:lysophospholipid acyltransferase family protein [Candidatus Roseilinea sp. NK_OTU-006]PJF46802.1 MAG: glycerol acyltransferase [Candidatus Thermofonsia Clade 3 bacterium]RMG64530.1 MAG: glycerol acyltransferase [Chloroflexota bacterium]
MLTARKNPLLNRLIYTFLIKVQLRSSFHRVYLRQAAPPPGSDSPPLIMFGNHSTWWDAHLMMALNEECWHTDGYVIVEDTQLVRYSFFRWCGAFSVNRRDPRSAVESMNYAISLLTAASRRGAPPRALLIFPQGKIRANDVRPLAFYQGAGRIASRTAQQVGACALYPIALRCEFIGEQKPDAFISVAHPVVVRKAEGADALDPRRITARMEQALTEELDRLRSDVVAYRLTSFTPLIQGARSINRIWDAVRGKEQIREVGIDPGE